MTYYSRLLARADDWLSQMPPGAPASDLVSELAAALRVAVAERDTARTRAMELETATTELADAFEECTGEYAKQLAASLLARCRSLVSK